MNKKAITDRDIINFAAAIAFLLLLYIAYQAIKTKLPLP